MMPVADQQPLLPQHQHRDGEGEGETSELAAVDHRKERVAEVLESKTFHKVIISLVRTYNCYYLAG
jgi:hypothetical protein